MATNQKSLGIFLLKKGIKHMGYYENQSCFGSFWLVPFWLVPFWLDLPIKNKRAPMIVKITNSKTESYQVAPPIQFK